MGPEQAVIYLDKKDFYQIVDGKNSQINNQFLEQFLQQLDTFELTQVTQVGHLAWARWISSYLDQIEGKKYNSIAIDGDKVSSVDLLNQLASELKLDLSAPVLATPATAEVFVDPYVKNEFSPDFLRMMTTKDQSLPDWVTVLYHPQDEKKMKKLGLSNNSMELSDAKVHIQNQNVLCFSDQSTFACCSRSYNVALFNTDSDNSLFTHGDLSLKSQETLYWSELFSILTYWKSGRLKELAFQWLKKGIEIETIELNHNRLMKRNLINYSTDLFCCHSLLDQFKSLSEKDKKYGLPASIKTLRQNMQNDPYSLSYSLKLLILITERMLASAACGERLFQRLGSDYHRIIIGEALVEGLFEGLMKNQNHLSIPNELRSFLQFMIQVDFVNDEWVERQSLKQVG